MVDDYGKPFFGPDQSRETMIRNYLSGEWMNVTSDQTLGYRVDKGGNSIRAARARTENREKERKKNETPKTPKGKRGREAAGNSDGSPSTLERNRGRKGRGEETAK